MFDVITTEHSEYEKRTVTEYMPHTIPITETFEAEDDEYVVPSMSKALVIIAYVIIGLFIIIGNLLVLIVVYRRKAMRNTTNILVGSLAFADLMIGFFVVPSTVISAVTNSGTKGALMCQLVPYIQLTSFTASILSMVLIACERFHVIVRTHKTPYTIKQTGFMVFGVWCISASYGLRVFIQTGTVYTFSRGETTT